METKNLSGKQNFGILVRKGLRIWRKKNDCITRPYGAYPENDKEKQKKKMTDRPAGVVG